MIEVVYLAFMMKDTYYRRGHGVIEWLKEGYYNVELGIRYMSLRLR